MTSNMTKRNNSIDIFRLICALLVVAIHIPPFIDINRSVSYFFCEIIARVAVPYFFVVSGYFYIPKLIKGDPCFKRYVLRLLTTYLFWTTIYYLIDYFQWGYKNLKDYIVTCVLQLFTGSHYHLWFFPALIFAVCVVTFLVKLRASKILIPISLVLYAVGCFGGPYYEIGKHIPVLSVIYGFSDYTDIRRFLFMAVPFFVGGYLLSVLKHKIVNKFSIAKLLVLFGVTVLLCGAELAIVLNFEIQREIVTNFGLYLVVIFIIAILLKIPAANLPKLADICRALANFTYYSHAAFILLINVVSGSILKIHLSETVCYILTSVFCLSVGFVIYKFNNKYLCFLIN